RREQEIFEIAHDVLALITDFYPLATGADCVGYGGVLVDPGTHLVKVADCQVHAKANLPMVRFQFAKNYLEQGRLAGPIGAERANPRLAQEGGAQIADDDAFSE